MRTFSRLGLASSAFVALALGATAPLLAQAELSEFQIRFGDMQRRPEGPPLIPEIPEMKEPTASWDKVKWRAANGGNKTVPRGRAWTPPESRTASRGAVGADFVEDLSYESVDLNDASQLSGFFGTPPDTMGAVGPTEYFTTLNNAYRVHDKVTGATIPALDVTDSAFWVAAVDPDNDGGGDPRVRFDRLADRWIVIAFTVATPNRILIALSDGPTLSTSTVWTQYFVQPGLANGDSALFAGGGCFTDYPMLGVDAKAMYLGANMFGCGSNTAILVVPFNGLNGTGGDASSAATVFSAAGDISTPMPVDNMDPNATVGFIIGHNPASDTELRLGRSTNPDGPPGGAGGPTLAFTPVTVSDKNDGYTGNSTPPNINGVPYPGVPAPTGTGTSWGFDPLGFRAIGGAIARDGKLWTAMTSSVDGPNGSLVLFPDTGDRHSVVYFEIDIATNTLVQDGNVYDQSTARGAEPFHTWMGSVAVNGPGHAVVGATVTDVATLAPSAAWAARHVDDTLGEFSEPTIYLPGSGTANARHSFEGQPRPTRWGDYAQVTVDPCDDMTFYTITEYLDGAVSTGGNWATGVARILSPPPTNATPSPSVLAGNNGSQVVTVSGEGFYQTPSVGMPACRTELEVTTSDAGLTVNSVTFNSATEIEIDFAADAAVSGAVTVTVTNPDGQEDDFVVTIDGTAIFADGFETGDTSAWTASLP